MEFTAWLSIASLCALGAMSPGPSLAVVTRNTLHGGRREGITTAISHGLGVGLYALLTVLGLAVIITQTPAIFNSIKIIGALFLAYLGIKSLMAKTQGKDSEIPAQTVDSWRSGFLIAFLNPKLAIFFLALFSQFVSPTAGWGERTIMVATAGGIDVLWYTIIACAFSHSALVDTLKQKAVWLDNYPAKADAIHPKLIWPFGWIMDYPAKLLVCVDISSSEMQI